MSILPVWVQWVQALGVPIFLALVALAGWWVGWQQMQMARVKLQHDLYDRRFKVFDSARKFLLELRQGQKLTHEAVLEFQSGIADAVFLLDDDLAKHLRDVRNEAMDALYEQELLPDAPRDEKIKPMLAPGHTRNEYLVRKLDELVRLFRPFLVLPKVRTFPWQRP